MEPEFSDYWKEQVLEAIGKSASTEAPKLERLLKYCLYKSDPVDDDALQIERVFLHVYEKDLPQKTGEDRSGKLRRLKKQLDERLNRFGRSSEARQFPFRVETMPEVYRLSLVAQHPNAKRFWRPYFHASDSKLKPRTRIVYPELLFHRSVKGGYFVRHLMVNDPAKHDIRQTCKAAGLLIPDAQSDFPPSWAFVSSGDTALAMNLIGWLERNGIETEHALANLNWESDEKRNLVLIGSSRNFPEIAEILKDEGFNFLIDEDRIVNQRPIDGEKPDYRDEFGSPIGLGLVSRTVSAKFGGALTVFSTNHPRVLSALGQTLSSEDDINSVLTEIVPTENADAPKKFELLFEVDRSEEQRSRRFLVRIIAKRVHK